MSLTLNPGAGGAALGTDVDGLSVNYEIVKIGFSASGVTPTQVSATNPLPDNLAQVGGNATKTGSGNGSTGSLNVYLATDQPQLANAQPVLQSGSWTVTANLGTLNGVALDTSVNGLLAAQGSATSGEKGPLVQGAVTTAAPTYTTGQTNPLSLTTGGLLRVDASGVAVPVTGTFWQTTQPVSLASIPALPAHQSVNVDQLNGTAPDTNSGVKSAGTLRVVIATDQPVLTNALAVSQNGTWTVQPGNTANTTPWLVTNVPGTSPGSTRSRVKAAATSTNSTNLKGSAGVVLGYSLYNNTASAKFFKFYDKATAPTVGTDTPAFTVIIPASGGANVEFSTGVPFSTGIGYGITGAVADTDTTNTAVDDVHGFVLWK